VQVGWPVEGWGASLDRAPVFPVVAGVGGLILHARVISTLPSSGAFPDGVVLVVGAVGNIIRRDQNTMKDG